MSESDSPAEESLGARNAGGAVYDKTRETLLTGVAITIPLVVTLYILTIALNFVANALSPFITVLGWFGVVEAFQNAQIYRLLLDLGIYRTVIDFFTEPVALLVLLGVVAIVGVVGRNSYGERIIEWFDLLLASIPGIGTVYKSFRRMGDVMLDEGHENFQDVKLVRCFGEEVFVLGFKTSDSPETIEDSTGHEEMVSMFLPLAPNPVTGGVLTYVPEKQVFDIDMTIEEGVRSILTSGVATGEGAEQTGPSMGNIREVTDIENLQDAISPDDRDDSS